MIPADAMIRLAPMFALALAGSACLAPADDAGETAPGEPEDVAETSAALAAGKAALDLDAAEWLGENIPQWSVYLGGRGHDLHPGRDPWSSFTNVYYDDPRDSDVFAPIILVRKGEEGDPSRWVQLSLTQHWIKGDRYLDELVECGTLTMMDLLVVMSELAKHADSYIEPRPIHVLAAATRETLRDLRTRSRFTCKDGNTPELHAFAGREDGPYGPPLPPEWVEGPDTHTHGPGPRGAIDASGHPLPPELTSTRPSLSQVPPNPAPPRTAEQNRVDPGDPRPKPSPFDRGYKPRSGEVKETFKCSGEVFYGYRAACLDLANKSISEKNATSIARFLGHMGATAQRQIDDIGSAFRHHLFNDGRGPACTESCEYMAVVGGGALGFGIMTLCLAATAGTDGIAGPACAGPLEQLIASTAGGLSGGAYQIWISNYCTKNVCTGK